MKANRINEFEAVMYQPSTGGYIPHIKVKDIRNHDWSGPKVRAEFPNEIEALRKFGINSKGRELYNTNNPRVVATKKEAKILHNQHKAIVTYLQLANSINFK